MYPASKDLSPLTASIVSLYDEQFWPLNTFVANNVHEIMSKLPAQNVDINYIVLVAVIGSSGSGGGHDGDDGGGQRFGQSREWNAIVFI